MLIILARLQKKTEIPSSNDQSVGTAVHLDQTLETDSITVWSHLEGAVCGVLTPPIALFGVEARLPEIVDRGSVGGDAELDVELSELRDDIFPNGILITTIGDVVGCTPQFRDDLEVLPKLLAVGNQHRLFELAYTCHNLSGGVQRGFYGASALK
ncbi:predicted protein [Sclerotinia sclerotiorum 1980 UF-70]|uniref:Uncharacterized protein n=1 Tax=Sclerotinia sclerotiorum (strain ATCC 18683 / 1980 / Ss-1) TaxID=665079 RepID=A7EZE2_SCLS1|nr:predicted protein [Sclerotinia sclerotiorum 1980 UF-70]EDN94834.1 predicted protein [Sclerotinia sclerotiorum 1980 UF-70]